MEIQCPKCKKTLKTQGRVEFPCRHCGTILRDPRASGATGKTDKLVELDEVLKIARKQGVYTQMKAVLKLKTYDKEDLK